MKALIQTGAAGYYYGYLNGVLAELATPEERINNGYYLAALYSGMKWNNFNIPIWIQEHKTELDTISWPTLSKFPVPQQKAIFQYTTLENKKLLWTDKLENANSFYTDNNVSELIDSLIYFINHSENLYVDALTSEEVNTIEYFQNEATSLLGLQNAYKLLISLNNVENDFVWYIQNGESSDCHCSTSSDWCNIGPHQNMSCQEFCPSASGHGCGTVWWSPCNGECYYNGNVVDININMY